MNMLENWTQAAPHWATYHEAIAQALAPVTQAMVEALQPGLGMRILDVAGGTGEPALTLARLVGAEGRVVHSDPVPAMLAAAQSRAAASGLGQVEHLEARAEQLPVEDASFDAVSCRFGLMFVERPEVALAEMLRAVRPGGVVCCAVWGERRANPFFCIPTDAVAAFLEDPDAQSADAATRLEDPSELRALAAAAGGVDVTVRELDFSMQGTGDFAAWWKMRVEMSPTLRAQVETLDDIQQEMAQDKAYVSLREHFTSAGSRIPARALLVVAHRPS